jgi:TPR repeat protein
MADVFISYKSVRSVAADHLARILELNGYSVWFDYALMSGDAFADQLERELRAARATVVVWCNLSVASKWVKKEASFALKHETLIPVWIEPANLPLQFHDLDTLNLTKPKWDGDPQSRSLDRLLTEIGKRVGREPKPEFAGLAVYVEKWRKAGAQAMADMPLTTDLEAKLRLYDRTSSDDDPKPPIPATPSLAPRRTVALRTGYKLDRFGPNGPLDMVLEQTLGLNSPFTDDHILETLAAAKASGRKQFTLDNGEGVKADFFINSNGFSFLMRSTGMLKGLSLAEIEKHASTLTGPRSLPKYEADYGKMSGPFSEHWGEKLAWLARAAAGDPVAQYMIAISIDGGDGFPRRPKDAYAWAKKAADQGHLAAMQMVAFFHLRGELTGTPDDATGLPLLVKAAEAGGAEAQFALACRYRDGKGLPKDEGLARLWFSRAAGEEPQ